MAFPTGWGRKAAITIASGKVGSGVTNYPILLTEANLPTEMFGDTANSALDGGGDIRFSSDASGATQLPVEIVNFDKSTDKAEIYVKVASIPSGGTDIYVWYAKAGETQPVANDTYGKNSVWTSDYKAVWHMGQDPSGTAPQLLDSTVNAKHGTSAGAMTSGDLVAGAIGSGIDFDRSNDHIALTNDSDLNINTNFTVTTVAKPSQITSLAYIAAKSATGANLGYIFGLLNSKWIFWANKIGTAFDIQLNSVTAPSTSAYHYVDAVYSSIGASSLSEPTTKTNHAAWCGYNNKMYIFGGHTAYASTATSTVNIYDPSDNTWATGSTAGITARNGAAAAEVDGVIYVMGGDAGTTLINEAYNVDGNSWSTKTSVPSGRGGAGVSAQAVGGKIYLTNGTNLEEYDPLGNSWATKANLPSTVGTYPATCTDGTYLYVIGGYNAGGSNKVYRYNPVTDSWGTQFATAPYGAWAGSCFIYNGYIYYGFGRKSPPPMSSALYKMRITDQAWTQLPSDSAGGNTLAAGVYGANAYYLGTRSPGPAETYGDGYNSKFDLTNEVWLTSAATLKLYVNGTLDNWITMPADGFHTSTAIFDIGSYNNGAAGAFWGGVIDELRVSNSPKTADFVTASSNNLLTPATFAIAGSPQDIVVPSGNTSENKSLSLNFKFGF